MASHCWDPEMEKQMVGKFGRFRKMTNNAYGKTTTDIIKVLVEVEDICVIPKVMHYSYKSLSDDRIRTYALSIEARGKSLPMSQIYPQNLELTLAASGRTYEVVDDWREEDMITTACNVNEQVVEEEHAGYDEGGSNGNQEGITIQGELNAISVKEVINAMMEEVEEEARIMEAGVKEGRAVDGDEELNSNLNLRKVNAAGPLNSPPLQKGRGPCSMGLIWRN